MRNQYRGINAHLHSRFQAEGGWSSFHTTHITDIYKLLKASLLPLGYTTALEASLQIRRLDEPMRRPESDVTIFDLDPMRSNLAPVPTGGGTLVMPIPDALALSPRSEKDYVAVAVYQSDERGEPVAWIELLSPSNKPGGQDDDIYRTKRLMVVESGIVFVELDYLNESAPTINGAGDHAYRVLVLDPRPSTESGSAHIYEFDADDPIPVITIPLNAGESLDFNLNEPYRKTFEEALYGLEWVDYGELPLHFDRYNRLSQERIANRMLAVQRQGDLETGDLPETPQLPLDEALAALMIQ